MSSLPEEITRRRTFAIISHPDAGKTTLTEKLLWFGGAIQVAGEVRGRKAARHATSDWMELEKQRGISVTSSVMQCSCRRRRRDQAAAGAAQGAAAADWGAAEAGSGRGLNTVFQITEMHTSENRNLHHNYSDLLI